MKINTRMDSNIVETEINIVAKTQADMQKIVDALKVIDMHIVGEKNGNFSRLRFSDIFYFECVDKRTFAYTNSDVFQVVLKLYEIEKTMPTIFFRCSKSTIINLTKVESFCSSFGARLLAKLSNGERISISRFYVKELKIKLEEI